MCAVVLTVYLCLIFVLIPGWAYGNNWRVWELQGASPQRAQTAEEQNHHPEWRRLRQIREVRITPVRQTCWITCLIWGCSHPCHVSSGWIITLSLSCCCWGRLGCSESFHIVWTLCAHETSWQVCAVSLLHILFARQAVQDRVEKLRMCWRR